MRQAVASIQITTRGKGLYEFTGDVERWVTEQAAQTGLVTLFIRHTSASLTIQENADPDVQIDLMTALEKLAPEEDRKSVV